MKNPLVSICIPSYNRPKELRRLLDSIDSTIFSNDIEIVVCEDHAPKREEVRTVVSEYRERTPYRINYVENDQNCGYDKNLRNLINNASGEYLLFMGDDDMFIPGRLDGFLEFIRNHMECGYFLRSYQNVAADGTISVFKYYDSDKTFEPSEDTYIEMFDKSVFISGFTMKRTCAKECETEMFDGSLLYQMYLLAEVCLKYPSAYYKTPITQAVAGSVPLFGSSDTEKGLYDPGEQSVRSSINFMRWYVKILDYVADKYRNDTNKRIKLNMSKYSYTFMALQRHRGVRVFSGYVKELYLMGFGGSVYFYIYYIGLLFFGEKKCSKVILTIKKMIGRRPRL